MMSMESRICSSVMFSGGARRILSSCVGFAIRPLSRIRKHTSHASYSACTQTARQSLIPDFASTSICYQKVRRKLLSWNLGFTARNSIECRPMIPQIARHVSLFRALPDVVSARRWYTICFAECDFILVFYIDLISSLHRF